MYKIIVHINVKYFTVQYSIVQIYPTHIYFLSTLLTIDTCTMYIYMYRNVNTCIIHALTVHIFAKLYCMSTNKTKLYRYNVRN